MRYCWTCHQTWEIKCSKCDGRGWNYTLDYEDGEEPNAKAKCAACPGSGKLHCPDC